MMALKKRRNKFLKRNAFRGFGEKGNESV